LLWTLNLGESESWRWNQLTKNDIPVSYGLYVASDIYGYNLTVYFRIITEGGHPTGDINGDGKVDMIDIDLACWAFGATPQNQHWNPFCDLNSDNRVGMDDIELVCSHFGEAG